VPSIKQMIGWGRKWISSKRRLAFSMVAFTIFEGLMFSGAFASIYWLKKILGEDKMKGLVQSNLDKIKATQEKESKSNYCSFNFIEPTQALVRDESSDDTDDDDDDAPAATADKKEVEFFLILIFFKLNLIV
jgi:hypothetical protein